MSVSLLPQSFWFRMALACPVVEGIPRAKGRLLDFPASCGLPDLGELEGRASWARAFVGYNASGLGVAFEVLDKAGPISPLPGQASGVDGVQVWIDTRDTRNVHRANEVLSSLSLPRSCPARDGRSRSRSPRSRSPGPSPMPRWWRPGSVQGRAERTLSGWRLELFFPSDSLHGFDPETNRRLGFYYQVTDPDRGDQFLGVGREFPVGEDPSLWATLRLGRVADGRSPC